MCVMDVLCIEKNLGYFFTSFFCGLLFNRLSKSFFIRDGNLRVLDTDTVKRAASVVLIIQRLGFSNAETIQVCKTFYGTLIRKDRVRTILKGSVNETHGNNHSASWLTFTNFWIDDFATCSPFLYSFSYLRGMLTLSCNGSSKCNFNRRSDRFWYGVDSNVLQCGLSK